MRGQRSGRWKAAVLLLSLGHRAAERVLSRMGVREAEQLAASMEEASGASLSEVDGVLQEFHQRLVAKGGGWGALEQLSVREAAQLLSEEHPQAAALALAHMRSHAHAAAVLQALPLVLQEDLAGRLALMERVSPGAVKEVTTAIDHSIKQPDTLDGLDALQHLLEHLDPHAADNILRRAANKYPQAAQQLQRLRADTFS